MDYDKENMMEFTGLNADELAELQKLMHGYHPADFAPETARTPSSPPNRPGMANMPNAANPANMPGIPNIPASAMPVAPMRTGSDAPPDRTDDEMQRFMEQGYLMGPNCFSRESQSYAGRLMEYINDEYRDYLTYTTLARRAPAAAARTVFRNLAADELRHARQFASAYFLITGKRYFPDRRTVTTPSMPPYSQALRDRYIAESRDAVKYRQFARETTDRCLRRMAIDTSNDERNHAQQILTLIQQQY